MAETTTKDILNYLENTDILEMFKQMVYQLETTGFFTMIDESWSDIFVSRNMSR